MLSAAVKALLQILSPLMRSTLWKSIGLALVLVAALAVGLQRLLSWFATSGEVWLEAALGPGFHTPLNILAWIVSIAAGFGAVFLMPAITSRLQFVAGAAFMPAHIQPACFPTIPPPFISNSPSSAARS